MKGLLKRKTLRSFSPLSAGERHITLCIVVLLATKSVLIQKTDMPPLRKASI